MKVRLKWFERPSRRELVSAQFDTPYAPANYESANDSFLPAGRFSRSRLRLVQDILASYPGGDLLDVGCGPGVMVRALLESRQDDFRIAALDQSLAMVDYCTVRAREIGKIYPATGQLEAMPFADASFDFTIVMGALEYTDARKAIHEIARVSRPGGLVIVSMLNPFSPYRLTEWFLLWPLVRALGAIQRYAGVPVERRHGIRRTGIHALSPSKLRSLMRHVGLQPIDTVYFDVTPAVPPFDRLPGMVRRAERTPYERTVTRGWRRWMGTGYLIVATRSCTAAVVGDRAANRNNCRFLASLLCAAPARRRTVSRRPEGSLVDATRKLQEPDWISVNEFWPKHTALALLRGST